MIQQLNDDNAEQITRPLFESIHNSYASSNFKSLIEDNNFSQKMKEDLSEQIFKEAIEEYYFNYGDLVEI